MTGKVNPAPEDNVGHPSLLRIKREATSSEHREIASVRGRPIAINAKSAEEPEQAPLIRASVGLGIGFPYRRNWKFESTFLQRTVRVSPDFTLAR